MIREGPKARFFSFFLGENWLEERGLSLAGLCYRWRTSPGFGWQTGRPRSASRWTVPPEWWKWVQCFNQDGKRSLILAQILELFLKSADPTGFKTSVQCRLSWAHMNTIIELEFTKTLGLSWITLQLRSWDLIFDAHAPLLALLARSTWGHVCFEILFSVHQWVCSAYWS